MDYVLAGHNDGRVFTDHRNILSVFAPLALQPTLSRHFVSKVQRRALFCSRLEYAIEHMSGKGIVFADMIRINKDFLCVA